MELEAKIKYGELLEEYSPMLTEKQRRAMEGYYLCDLSLTEIAEEQGLSRQAIFDTVQKTDKILDDLEQKLQLNRRKQDITEILNRLENGTIMLYEATAKIKNLI